MFMEVIILIKDLILSTVMAGFIVYIAYQQLDTNRKKLKLDLYNKRFEVYSVALEFYQELTGNGASTDLVRKFIKKKEAAQFLFSEDPSIYSLLNEMHEKMAKFEAPPYMFYDKEKGFIWLLMRLLNERHAEHYYVLTVGAGIPTKKGHLLVTCHLKEENKKKYYTTCFNIIKSFSVSDDFIIRYK